MTRLLLISVLFYSLSSFADEDRRPRYSPCDSFAVQRAAGFAEATFNYTYLGSKEIGTVNAVVGPRTLKNSVFSEYIIPVSISPTDGSETFTIQLALNVGLVDHPSGKYKHCVQQGHIRDLRE